MGPEFSFSHLAAKKYFGKNNTFVKTPSIEEVFEVIEKKKSDFGVIPIENSNEGSVTVTLDILVSTKAKIVGEIILPINLQLAGLAKNLKEIKTIYSHPQAIAQSRNWLRKNLPFAHVLETSSTSMASRLAADDPKIAAVTSALAAKANHLNTLAKNINDNKNNWTRFIIISQKAVKIPSKKLKKRPLKTSLILSVKDRVGALRDIINVISDNKINMTKIESRPTKKKAWQYIFFIDIDGSQMQNNVKKTLRELKPYTKTIKVLGSFFKSA